MHKLHANRRVGNYWIRANPNFGNTGFENHINSAILRYEGAPTVEPRTVQTNSTRPLNEIDLHPLFPDPAVRQNIPRACRSSYQTYRSPGSLTLRAPM